MAGNKSQWPHHKYQRHLFAILTFIFEERLLPDEGNSFSASVRHRVISKNVLTVLAGENKVEASTTKVSSKGQVVIPANVRKAANLKKGERILAIAIGDTIVLKKIVDKSFEETMKPVWDRILRMGLTEEDLNALIDEARAQDSS